MKRREQKKQTIFKKSFYSSKRFFLLLGSVGILVVFFTIFAIHAAHFFSSNPPPETEKNSMKKLPPDVKKALHTSTNETPVSATPQVPIFMYHYVEYVQDKKDTERQLLNVTPNVFEEQIQTLLAAGYTFITAKGLGDILDGTIPLPPKPIILTFDDGHWDLDTNVLPILKKYNIHATAYIVPGFINTNSDSLTTAEMQDIINSGLIDVGAHTVHHASLKGQPFVKVEYEITQSKAMLEKQYHIHVYSFAYPYGSFDEQALKIVKQDGFTTTASTIAGAVQSQTNRFFLYRVRPGYKIGEELLNYLHYWEMKLNQ